MTETEQREPVIIDAQDTRSKLQKILAQIDANIKHINELLGGKAQ